jgi:phosphohistidine phosphatase
MLPPVRELFVLRHAKSSHDHPRLDDHDRPLNPRGLRDAPQIGERLGSEGAVPDRIVSSTALRARTTAKLVAEAAGAREAPLLDPRLYGAGPDECLALLREQPDHCRTVMIVGHNPTFEQLVELLTGSPERFPTAALARIRLPIERWADVAPGVRGELVTLWRPKELD